MFAETGKKRKQKNKWSREKNIWKMEKCFCFQWHRHILFDPADSRNAWQAKKEESEINVTESLQKEWDHFFSGGRRGSVIYVECLEKERPWYGTRGCAIDETALQINFVKTAEELPGMQLIDLPAPTSDIRIIFRLSASSQAYVSSLKNCRQKFGDRDVGSAGDCREKGERTRRTAVAECLAAQEISELEIYVKWEQSYRLGFTAVRYEKTGKSIH